MRHITLVRCLSLAVVSSACTDAGRPLIIIQNQVPGAGCTVSSSEGTVFRPSGIVDVNSPGGYLFTPLVQNVGIGNRDDPSERLVTIRGADVEVLFPEGLPGAEAVPDTVITDLFSGTIEPDGDTTAFFVNALTKNFLDGVKQTGNLSTDGSNIITVVAQVSVFGNMDGGTVESEVFNYPIDVCDGCLIRNLGDCSALTQGFVGESFVCIGHIQDAMHTCCTSSGRLLCPAAGPL